MYVVFCTLFHWATTFPCILNPISLLLSVSVTYFVERDYMKYLRPIVYLTRFGL